MQRTLEEVIYSNSGLEQLSFINTVYFYRKELRRIRDGEDAMKVFRTSNTRTRLIKQGVLDCVYVGAGRKILISDATKRLLEEISFDFG